VNELHVVEHQATFVMLIDNGVRNDRIISQANQGMHHSEQRDTLKNGITNAGGKWPPSNSELAINYTNLFQQFVN
jgi:hypothetical protein